MTDDAPTWEEYGKAMGVLLQQARARKGISQEKVAHQCGLAGYTYQKFEKGESRPGVPLNPRLTTLTALSQVLDIPLADLLPPPYPAIES